MTLYQLSIYDGTDVDIIIKDDKCNTLDSFHVGSLEEWHSLRSYIDEMYDDLRIFSVELSSNKVRVLISAKEW